MEPNRDEQNPYEAPAATGVGRVVALGEVSEIVPGQYKSAKSIGVAALVALGIYQLLSWALHLVDLANWNAIEAHAVTQSLVDTETLLANAATGSRLIGAVIFLVWIHRACANAWAISASSLTIKPGAAVGWWFVPFAGIVMPYRAMNEIGSVSDPSGAGLPPPGLLLWWILFLGSNVLQWIAEAIGVSDLAGRVTFSILGTVAATISIAILARIVTAIGRGQEQIVERAWSRD